jgi:hypothetical protein
LNKKQEAADREPADYIHFHGERPAMAMIARFVYSYDSHQNGKGILSLTG